MELLLRKMTLALTGTREADTAATLPEREI